MSAAPAGILAKPIIDMLLVVDDLDALDRNSAALGGLGIEALGGYGIPGRRYFRKHTRPRRWRGGGRRSGWPRLSPPPAGAPRVKIKGAARVRLATAPRRVQTR